MHENLRTKDPRQGLYLSLFSGGGLGDLSHQRLKGGWQCAGYVENNLDAQETLKARIEDGSLDPAPIFGCIKDFVENYAHNYQNMVEMVAGGFPCQTFSLAGKRQPRNNPRNLWPSVVDVLRIIRPPKAHLENVSNLLSGRHGYFGTILGDLAELGYDASWEVLSASKVGALHLRKRVWLVAHLVR